MSTLRLSPPLLINAYCQGVFPMAIEGEIYWFDPDPRAILPLEEFHLSRSLRRTMKRVWVAEPGRETHPFLGDVQGRTTKPPLEIRVNTAFETVIDQCADPRRPGGWINEEIRRAYVILNQLGWAHSVETWLDGQLVGGLYGIAIQGFFAGESMFSVETDASKVALVYLVDRLRRRDFALLDVQFSTPHLSQFGVVEITRKRYKRLLEKALNVDAAFR